jgi:ketosteroid isomerase-like protein
MLRARLASLELDLQEVQVHIDGDMARVQATGSALGSLTGQQGQFLEIHSGIVTLAKENGDWRITGATHLQDERLRER